MKYTQGIDGEWIRLPLSNRHKIGCCDCGLVHLLEFRIRKGRVEFRAFRDNRATAQVRRGRIKSA